MVSPKTRAIVWARGAGRCQYLGCNQPLIGDLVSGNEDANFGLIAHIVAEQPGGPRGDPVRSPALADDPSNLMLMCYQHHKLIDVDDKLRHDEQRLLNMKAAHEERIKIVTDIAPDLASQVLRYGARIGAQDSLVSFDRVAAAMLPERYPSHGSSIGIEILGNSAEDSEDQYWVTEQINLQRQLDNKIKPLVQNREITHLSIFALAPIPLLIELGRSLGDIVPAEVYQLHREPAGWRWAKNGPRVDYKLQVPPSKGQTVVALKLALSATITDDRISSVLGEDIAIWAITATNNNNDVMRYPEDLAEFRRLLRFAYNEIKVVHGPNAVINIFPAIPVSAAVECGRVWMPKADLPLVIFDETRTRGFVSRLRVG